MYDERIKDLQESVNKFQEASANNKELTKSLTKELEQLRKVTSVTSQEKYRVLTEFEFDEYTMINVLKKNIEELECLCDT